jgi:hypothetical protein
LHTMSSSNNSSRRFYTGQWIDCRDTVNQWLEATIMSTVDPIEILRAYDSVSHYAMASHQPTSDPVVSYSDLDGRRRLLLEPCDASNSEEQIDGVHYRRRDTNHGVQLLHVHYNGWPMRWDEWIRSDSERIRPFRARTRHSGSQASPSVQTTMSGAPSVSFSDPDDDDNDSSSRLALLPELHRIVMTAQEMLDAAVTSNSTMLNRTTENDRQLPWLATSQDAEASVGQQTRSLEARRLELEALAPFLDRLGRTLTDAAPHIAALASSLGECDDEEDDNDETDSNEEHPSTLGGLLSLLSRDRRRNEQSVASSNAANPNSDVSTSHASSAIGENEDPAVADEEEEHDEAPVTSLSATVDPDHRDFVAAFVNTTRGDSRSGSRLNSSGRSGGDEITTLVGAYLAAASLAGLTSVGFGGEDGNSGSGTDGLTRLLRGNGGGGIDIHIHAVVTSPGLDGGIGLAALAAAGSPSAPVAAPVAPAQATASPLGALGTLFGSRDASSRRGSRRVRSSASQPSSVNDDDSGIFAELYSETPEPINPNSPTNVSSNSIPPDTSQLQHEWTSQDDSSAGAVSSPGGSRSRASRRLLSSASGMSGNNSIGTSSSTTNTSLSNPTTPRSGGGLLRRFFRRATDNNE